MKLRFLLMLAMLVALTSCRSKGISQDEAHALVEKYNEVVAEAYRRCDIRLIDSVVGMNTVAGDRLTGLIGVRLDMGISLDSKLVSLEIAGSEQEGDLLKINTKEKWTYRDLKIGTGEQVGDASEDYYELQYIFKKINNKWMVEETKFTSDPKVGRKTIPWGGEARTMHNFPVVEDKKKE